MNYIVVDCAQRSDEWRAARLGRLTGTGAAAVLAKGKGTEEAATRRNLRVQLALERVTGRSIEDGYTTYAMRQGIEREPDACSLYEVLTGRLIVPTGFIALRELEAGCSLDGAIYAAERIVGNVELKCPIPATHLEYLTTGKVPKDYMAQMTHNLWVTGADWCDWMSYNPDFPEGLQAKLVRVAREDAVMAEYDRTARVFLGEVEAQRNKIHALAADAGIPVF